MRTCGINSGGTSLSLICGFREQSRKNRGRSVTGALLSSEGSTALRFGLAGEKSETKS